MRGTLLVLLAIGGFATAWGSPPIEVQVDHPVVPELMGGCSLRCAFPWQTFATLPGKPAVPLYTLDDNDAFTAWTDAVVGSTLTFQFPRKLPRELNETPFYGFDMANGNIKSDALFKAYGRVKKAQLSYNGKPIGVVNFVDTKRWQVVSFDDIMAKQGDVFSMQILEIYPGTQFPAAAAITELILQGAH